MLCNVCIGVLQHRQNILVPVKEHDEGDAVQEAVNEEGDEEQRTTRVSQKHELPIVVECGHHRTSTTLALSAASGCHICQPFWDQCSSSEKECIRIVEEKIASGAIRTTGEDSDEDVYKYKFFSFATVIFKPRNTVEATLNLTYNPYKAWFQFTSPYWTTYMLKPGTHLREPVKCIHH
jgi:hypothetical protein